MSISYDPRLLDFAETQVQIDNYSALLQEGSQRKAAKLLGKDEKSIRHTYKTLKRRAAQRGYSPEAGIDQPLPDGQVIKGISDNRDENNNRKQLWLKTTREGANEEEVTRLPDPKTITKESMLFDQDRRVTQHWVSTKPDLEERVKAWEEYANHLAERLPILAPKKAPKLSIEADDLISVYPIGDHHIGSLIWHLESFLDKDWDLKIAEEILKKACHYLMGVGEKTSHCFLPILGDFMHYDGVDPVTTRSKNILNTDTRYAKMSDVALDCIFYMIELALQHHEHVHVVYEPGNHDDSSALLIARFVNRLYRDEPRVTVDISPRYYHYYQFGKNLFMTHHGHATKLDKLPLLMACDAPKMWGETLFRSIYTGHVHHRQRLSEKEFEGVIVESFEVLGAGDAYADQHGYRSMRSMQKIVYHRETGERFRTTFRPEMVEE